MFVFLSFLALLERPAVSLQCFAPERRCGFSKVRLDRSGVSEAARTALVVLRRPRTTALVFSEAVAWNKRCGFSKAPRTTAVIFLRRRPRTTAVFFLKCGG